jgi:hypothetical protein
MNTQPVTEFKWLGMRKYPRYRTGHSEVTVEGSGQINMSAKICSAVEIQSG